MALTSCRHFSGYKPCGLHSVCEDSCPKKSVPESYLLVIHLGALGAVVRATCILEPLRRKYPRSHITWVTDAPADQLLKPQPLIDRVLTSRELWALSALQFDAAFVIDKSLKAAGILAQTRAQKVFGFAADPRGGAILPATPAAEELWSLGLDNHKKFFVNQKPETELLLEALELETSGRDYCLPLTAAEEALRREREREWRSQSTSGLILGINTGCSAVIPYKKLSVEFHRDIIQSVAARLPVSIVLLGGPEDTERNAQIGESLPVIQSPTRDGLRDGLVSVAACDVVLTGDSLGMHMAIAQKKYTVAWFGPTCAQEIELFGRGEKILTQAACAPCWKRLCQKETLCYDQVSLPDILDAITRGFEQCQPTSSSKPPFSETSSSASR